MKAFVNGLSLDASMPQHGVDLIPHFVYDQAASSLIFGTQRNRGNEHLNSSTMFGKRGRTTPYSTRLLQVLSSSISSMSLSDSRVLLATTHGEEQRPSIVLMKITDGGDDRGVAYPPDLEMSVVYHHAAADTIWCSVANPFLGAEVTNFAVGMNDRVLLYSDADGRWDDSQFIRSGSDVQSVEWLSRDVLLYGTRSRGIGLWDVRSSGKVKDRIRLNQPISHLRRIDESRIIARSTLQTLAFYDLRMARQDASSPYIDLSSESRGPQSSRNFGTGVSTHLGLLAAAYPDNTVQLYSLKDGERLGQVTAPKKDDFSWITCLKFAQMGGWKMHCWEVVETRC